jgi:two-component system, OmpR family, sensor histidine kinase KdpD
MDEEIRPDPNSLLKQANQINKGKLTVFLGAAAGVGKTFAMLSAAKERIKEGKKVLIGWIDTHHRKETDEVLEGIPRLEPIIINYKGRDFHEPDIETLLRIKPDIAVIDEFAHSNISGSKNTKRYSDIEELLDNGIDVYTALNIQHLESLNDVVSQITGILVRETIPDKVLENAEIHLVDIDADVLIQRLKDGKIYIPTQAQEAIQKFFRPGNINALREISLRYTADNVDVHLQDYMKSRGISGPWRTGEKVMVCISKNNQAADLIRIGKRMSASLNAELIVANVSTPWEPELSSQAQNNFLNNLKLAESLGAEIISLTGVTIADEIINLAKKRNITQLIIGKPLRPRPIEWFQEPVVDKIIRKGEGIRVHVIPTGIKKTAYKEKDNKRNYRNFLLPLGVGLGLIAVFYLLSFFFESFIGIFNITVLFSIPAAIVAFYGNYLSAALVAIVSFFTFDFFFIPPKNLFTIEDLRFIPSFFIYLILAMFICYLSKKTKLQVKFVEKREEQLSILYSLSRKISAKIDLQEVIENVKEKIEKLINCKVVFLVRSSNGNLEIQGLLPEAELKKKLSLEKEKAIAEWVLVNGRIAGKGTDFLNGSELIYFPLKTQGDIVGVTGIFLDKEQNLLTAEQQKLVESICGLLASVIYRINISHQLGEAKVLEESQKLYNALFNSISHDLRTPLTSIIGSSSTLENEEAALNKSNKTELVKNINRSALRMLKIVNNLLDMARIESGQMNLKYEWCDIEDIIGVAVKQVDIIEERQLEINLGDNIPLIWVDFSLMELVFVNLLDNAVKYSKPQSKITVSVKNETGELFIMVSDEGTGIPDKESSKIFEKFYRMKIADNIQGTGLGLSICKAIIELHAGKIWADKNAKNGLTIKILLPLHVQPQITGRETQYEQ